jgi:hypothetical protein
VIMFEKEVNDINHLMGEIEKIKTQQTIAYSLSRARKIVRSRHRVHEHNTRVRERRSREGR